MWMDKKVSIIMPTYNGSEFIRESIESCLEQSYGNIELIIVEDGSDCLKKILSDYKDNRITYLRNNENKGISFSLNVGFGHSSGEYLTWTSDDNIYEREAIQRMVTELEKNRNIDFVYANFKEIDKEGNVLRPVHTRRPPSVDEVNYIGLCFLYKRTIFDKLGGYSLDAFLVEDYEYWLRIYHNGFKMRRIDEFLYYVRMHEKCLTCEYDRDIIEEKAQWARDRYISRDKKFYQHGMKNFYKGNRTEARKLLVRSLK
jgi:glycosyltransferase involved in cell wall biosynthesis